MWRAFRMTEFNTAAEKRDCVLGCGDAAPYLPRKQSFHVFAWETEAGKSMPIHFAGFTIKKEKEGDMKKEQFGGIMREKKAIPNIFKFA